MNATRLNALSNDLFSYKKDMKANETIKVCSFDGSNSRNLNRAEIIAAARLATAEYFGFIANATHEGSYKSRLNSGSDFQKKVWHDVVLYCSAVARKAVDLPAYATMAEVEADRSLFKDTNFWRAMQYIAQEVIYPLLPAVIPDGMERIVDWSYGRLGETKLIDIPSNDFFLFDDDSWGSVSSKPYQYLYKSQIAITPKPYTAKTKIKWYQDVIDGEAGRYFAAFARGMYNKMYAIALEQFKAATANTKYVPAGLTYDSYSPTNWNRAVMAASALNDVSRNQLVAMGTLSSLSNILPTVGTPAVAAGIQGMIGEEWVRNGFLGNVAGVDLIETGLAVVPHTQNYNPKFIGLDDATSENIYIMAKVGRAPLAGVIANGSPITIDFTPRETADMTIDISETAVFDIKPAISSKIVKITV